MKKRLYRSRRDTVISGVCGGIADYLNVDPVIVRVLAVLIGFASGNGILIYIIAAIAIPKEPSVISRTNTDEADSYDANKDYVDTEYNANEKTYSTQEEAGQKRGTAGMLLGIILISLGLFFLAGNFVDLRYLFRINMNYVWSFFNYLGNFFWYIGRFSNYIWPVFLIALGLVFFIKSK
ncbi:PspC domain-containing protein [Alkalicella caledoniensis]|uniref:PspC domain-containing protein n=1 Tax=Alkalicella caledoniensis TaxID=2731377 RepID=A0A7G9W6Z6_ALKCA|nr:PspC domain-containing protein [Alkalicella caledoniensis]QNO14458.1 PspC domain-containing protein [Alkalicella caledoniensis]